MIDLADSNAVYYYHFDGLGSVVALTDSNGTCVQTYEYSVYGHVAASDPNHPNPFMFTGRQFDVETGLYYYRARYYNPYLGRFLQTDPVGYGYGYCGNNPIAYTDPDGLYPIRWSPSWDPCDPCRPRNPQWLPWLPWDPCWAPSIKVAFCDMLDDQGPSVANGAQFLEAADDFTLYFHMNSSRDIINTLASLRWRYRVTDVYIYDHCGNDPTDGKWGLEFGNENLSWDRELEGFCRELQLVTSKSCTIHFRHCYVAMDFGDGQVEDRKLLKDLARWSNRAVTGVPYQVIYGGPRVYDPKWEQPGADYVCVGGIYKAHKNAYGAMIVELLYEQCITIPRPY
jgi:RHS repeat-associated protein